MGDNEPKPGLTAGGEILTRPEANSAEFEAAYDENFSDTLDLETWTLGEDVAAFLDRTEQEIAEAIERENAAAKYVREIIFPQISTAPGAPKNAGKHEAQRGDLERVHRGLLFNGGVEACDGTRVAHDTLPLTITQLGVCLVSYNGQQGSWAHRLFRRDLRQKLSNPVEEVLDLLHRREKREAIGEDEGNSDATSVLAGRGIMAWAERAILREKSNAPWRMGHGHPAPYELLTNLWSSNYESFRVPLELIEWYVTHRRFVFVPSAPRKRHWLTLGNALRPMEYLIFQTIEPEIRKYLDRGNYRGKVRTAMEDFCREVAPQIVVGVYRASLAAPPYLFYAHVEYAEMAAHIAMADSILQEHRGFPMLIELADTVCTATFGADSFLSSVQAAYADAGQPFRYLGERETRLR
jgi:hypothetical protein